MREGWKMDALLLCVIALAAALGIALFDAGAQPAPETYAPVASASGGGLIYVEGRPLIDINTAGEELLQTLPGIGPVLAGEIVSWREERGAFRSIEEIMEVKGIGEKKFEAMRERIAAGEWSDPRDGTRE